MTSKIKRRDQVTLLDLRETIPVSTPQDFNAIRQQVRKIQARKIAKDEDKHFSRLVGVTVQVPGSKQT